MLFQPSHSSSPYPAAHQAPSSHSLYNNSSAVVRRLAANDSVSFYILFINELFLIRLLLFDAFLTLRFRFLVKVCFCTPYRQLIAWCRISCLIRVRFSKSQKANFSQQNFYKRSTSALNRIKSPECHRRRNPSARARRRRALKIRPATPSKRHRNDDRDRRSHRRKANSRNRPRRRRVRKVSLTPSRFLHRHHRRSARARRRCR